MCYCVVFCCTERVKRSLEGHTGVPVEKQSLRGWPGHADPPDMVDFNDAVWY